MNTQFSIDDDGVLWFTYAHGISVRLRSSTTNPANLKLMGYVSEESESDVHDVLHSDDPHLDLTREFLSKPHKSSRKMYNLMSNFYGDLKERLGVIDVHEAEDDILNDPVPITEKFPKPVLKCLTANFNLVRKNSFKHNKYPLLIF